MRLNIIVGKLLIIISLLVQAWLLFSSNSVIQKWNSNFKRSIVKQQVPKLHKQFQLFPFQSEQICSDSILLILDGDNCDQICFIQNVRSIRIIIPNLNSLQPMDITYPFDILIILEEYDNHWGNGLSIRIEEICGRYLKEVKMNNLFALNMNNKILFKFSSKFVYYLYQKYRVVFMRHGESTWNQQNRFTGWTDVRLSSKGIDQARNAGKKLLQNSFKFNLAFTSVLTRSIQTFNYVADQMYCHYIPVHKQWRLNERHYGSLQGLDKQQTAKQHGVQQVKKWRRSYNISPPKLQQKDQRCPHFDSRYENIDNKDLPLAEVNNFYQSLEDTVKRVLPLWNQTIVPAIKSSNVIVVAHGNSLRAIIKHLDKITDQQIVGLNIPTAIPLVYEFDQQLNSLRSYYLGDPQQVQQKIKNMKRSHK